MIGWLHVGSEPERNHLKVFLKDASEVPWVTTEGDDPVLAESLVGQPERAIEFVRSSKGDPPSRASQSRWVGSRRGNYGLSKPDGIRG